MNTPVPKIVGSTPVRIAAVGSVGLCFLFATGLIPCGGAVRLAAFACGVFAFIGIIFSFVSLFKAWMRFGQTLNKCVSIFLFSLVYIFFVPFFKNNERKKYEGHIVCKTSGNRRKMKVCRSLP